MSLHLHCIGSVQAQAGDAALQTPAEDNIAAQVEEACSNVHRSKDILSHLCGNDSVQS
jgi:hypothetical protein